METVKVTELPISANGARSGGLHNGENYFLSDSTNEYEAYAYFNYPASTFKNDFKDCVSINSVKFIVGRCNSYYDELTWQFSVDGYDYIGGSTWNATALKQTGMQYSSSAVYEASGKFEKRDTLGTAFEHTAENVPTVTELTTNGVQTQWKIKLAWSAKNSAYYDLYTGYGNIEVVGTKSDGTSVTKTYSKVVRDKGGVLFAGTTRLVAGSGTLAYSMTPAKLFNTACWNSATVKSATLRMTGVASSDIDAVWTMECGLTAGTSGYTKDSTGVYEIPKTQIYSGTLTADGTEVSFAIENPGDFWTNGAYVAFKVSRSNGAKLAEFSLTSVVLDMEYEIDEKELGTVQVKMGRAYGGTSLGFSEGDASISLMTPKNAVGLKCVRLKGRVRLAKPGDSWSLKKVRLLCANVYQSLAYRFSDDHVRSKSWAVENVEGISGTATKYAEWQSFELELNKGYVGVLPRGHNPSFNYNLFFEGTERCECYAYLEWMMPDYTVNLTAGENGEVEGSGTYHFGQPATIKAIGNENYTLKRWNDRNEGAVRQVVGDNWVLTTSSDTAPSNDVTLSAEFESKIPTPVYSIQRKAWGGKPFKALLKLTEIEPEKWDALTVDTVDGLKTRTWASLIEE